MARNLRIIINLRSRIYITIFIDPSGSVVGTVRVFSTDILSTQGYQYREALLPTIISKTYLQTLFLTM